MDVILTQLEAFGPTLIAIMCLAMFTPKTRWLCYTAVTLAITSELIPNPINMTALLACISCLATLLLSEYLRVQNITYPFFSRVSIDNKVS